jgi:hypothetical protein
MSVYEETMRFSESRTRPKAAAVWTGPPREISPRKWRGAATTKGKIVAGWL